MQIGFCIMDGYQVLTEVPANAVERLLHGKTLNIQVQAARIFV